MVLIVRPGDPYETTRAPHPYTLARSPAARCNRRPAPGNADRRHEAAPSPGRSHGCAGRRRGIRMRDVGGLGLGPVLGPDDPQQVRLTERADAAMAVPRRIDVG